VTALPGSLVSAPWLMANRDSVTVVDSRSYIDGRSGRAAYHSGHIPGAVFVELDVDLSTPPTFEGGRHPLPSAAAFSQAMQDVGISDGDQVVVYDDVGGGIAARLWWMLRAVGESAALLDGGLGAWEANGGEVTVNAPAVSEGRFTARPWPAELLISADEVDAARGRDGVAIFDARSADRYAGMENPVDPRFGHIPGATSAPWTSNLADTGLTKDRDALRAQWTERGAMDADDVILYCGSGVTACHNALVLDQLGISTRLYVGSWSAWGADPNRPLET